MTCHHSKKFSHKLCFYYNKDNFIYNLINMNTVGNITFDNYQQYTELYNESFTKKKGSIIYTANDYTNITTGITNDNAFTTLDLPNGSINFILNAVASNRLLINKRTVCKIISGSRDYINIKGYIVIDILDNGIRRVKVRYNN